MAKTRGILEPVSGPVGPVSYGSWKGIPWVRIRKPKTKKKRKRTEAQIANQEKFNYVNWFLKPFHQYLNIGFKNEAVQKTEISAAFSVVFHQAVVGKYPNLSIDYSKVKISTGPLPPIYEVTMTLTAPNAIELNWQNRPDREAKHNDQVMLVIYCPELHRTDGFAGNANRNLKKYTFEFNSKMVGKVLEVYIAVTSFERNKISESQYLGKITPLNNQQGQLSMF